jgi:hypothetical protein
MDQKSIYLDKPIYTAFTVLDISKAFMYMWHYDKIKKWYGNDALFLFTDTDSLAYKIQTEDLYKDLHLHRQLFDFSDYDHSHPLFSIENRKVIGTMKDEAQGKILKSFIGVSPKMYSFSGENIEKRAVKGVKKSLVERDVNHEVFKQVLFDQKKFYSQMVLIRSKGHKVTTGSYRKVALHCFDSKRYILPDGIHTLAHNHYKTK